MSDGQGSGRDSADLQIGLDRVFGRIDQVRHLEFTGISDQG